MCVARERLPSASRAPKIDWCVLFLEAEDTYHPPKNWKHTPFYPLTSSPAADQSERTTDWKVAAQQTILDPFHKQGVQVRFGCVQGMSV